MRWYIRKSNARQKCHAYNQIFARVYNAGTVIKLRRHDYDCER